jgi:hypothetical protein
VDDLHAILTQQVRILLNIRNDAVIVTQQQVPKVIGEVFYVRRGRLAGNEVGLEQVIHVLGHPVTRLVHHLEVVREQIECLLRQADGVLRLPRLDKTPDRDRGRGDTTGVILCAVLEIE